MARHAGPIISTAQDGGIIEEFFLRYMAAPSFSEELHIFFTPITHISCIEENGEALCVHHLSDQ